MVVIDFRESRRNYSQLRGKWLQRHDKSLIVEEDSRLRQLLDSVQLPCVPNQSKPLALREQRFRLGVELYTR